MYAINQVNVITMTTGRMISTDDTEINLWTDVLQSDINYHSRQTVVPWWAFLEEIERVQTQVVTNQNKNTTKNTQKDE